MGIQESRDNQLQAITHSRSAGILGRVSMDHQKNSFFNARLSLGFRRLCWHPNKGCTS